MAGIAIVLDLLKKSQSKHSFTHLPSIPPPPPLFLLPPLLLLRLGFSSDCKSFMQKFKQVAESEEEKEESKEASDTAGLLEKLSVEETKTEEKTEEKAVETVRTEVKASWLSERVHWFRCFKFSHGSFLDGLVFEDTYVFDHGQESEVSIFSF
ncbi:hypothetical protein ISN44_As13g017570 [Arabidopsis suecica]|uniref:Uncharacterized protein n=1 Tax=Arabidopsis suecica TaxID=45249 RepID=A0A8T1XYH8_ARASU|nr:hypothetical protein ISN44_As13g017570 [Arabidopsis suecica]